MSTYQESNIRNLYVLLELAKLMGKEVDLDSLLQFILVKTTEVMNAERSSLFLYDAEKNELWSKIAQGLQTQEIRLPMDTGIIGIVAKTKKTINILDVYKDERFNAEFDKISGFKTKSVLCIPLIGTSDNLIGVIEVLNKKSNEPFNDHDESFLTAFGAHIVVALERAQLIKEHMESQRLEESLKLAKKIQMNVISRKFPPFPDKVDILDIYAYMEPAKKVGGDLYEFFLVEDNFLYFAIGDVADKGVAAALFMTITVTAFKAMIKTKTMQSVEIMSKLNNYLCENNDLAMFCTLFLGILNLKTGELEFSNAGHNPPYLLHKNGSVSSLHIRGNALGILENSTYSSNSIFLDSGDGIFLYTDGVNEALNKNIVEYSTNKLEIKLRESSKLKAQDLIKEVIADLKSFVGDYEQSDDITALMIRYFKP